MSWSGSAVFAAFAADVIACDPSQAGAWANSLNPGARQCFAFFNDQVTPDRAAPRPATIRGAGEWLAARELSAAGWPGNGNPTWRSVQGVDAAGAAGFVATTLSRANTTLTGVAGDLVYDTGAGGQGLCFHDFGGLVDVDNGTMTVSWASPPGTFLFGV
jgi:hypothetical protein